MKRPPKFTPAKSEIWKDVVGFTGVFQVSSLGRIRNIRKPHASRLKNADGTRTFTRNRGGYTKVELVNGKRRANNSLHVFVCRAFHGPKPRGHEVAHIDGDQTNCRADNLKWATHKENMGHMRAHGTRLLGEMVNHAKMTEEKIRRIFRMYCEGKSQKEIGAVVGLMQNGVSRILSRELWGHVSIDPTLLKAATRIRNSRGNQFRSSTP